MFVLIVFLQELPNCYPSASFYEYAGAGHVSTYADTWGYPSTDNGMPMGTPHHHQHPVYSTKMHADHQNGIGGGGGTDSSPSPLQIGGNATIAGSASTTSAAPLSTPSAPTSSASTAAAEAPSAAAVTATATSTSTTSTALDYVYQYPQSNSYGAPALDGGKCGIGYFKWQPHTCAEQIVYHAALR